MKPPIGYAWTAQSLAESYPVGAWVIDMMKMEDKMYLVKKSMINHLGRPMLYLSANGTEQPRWHRVIYFEVIEGEQ